MKDEKGINDVVAAIVKEMPAVIITHPTDMTPEEYIFQVLKHLPGALAEVAHSAEPEADVESRRVEVAGLCIVKLKRKQEREAHGHFEGVIVPAHYKLSIRPHLGLLEKFKRKFDKNVRR